MLNVTGGDGGPKHFGSLLTITDYSSDAHVFSSGITFRPSALWTLQLRGNAILTTASFDPPQMPGVTAEVEEQIHAGLWDYSMIDQYSDIDFQQYDVSADGSYQLTPKVRLNLGATYRDLTDNQGYVYGLESGSLWIVRTGLTYGW